MLHIYLGHRNGSLHNIDGYFNIHFKSEWLKDTMVKEMILDIDDSEVKDDGSIISPVLGSISPHTLSTGVKALIIMLKVPELVVNASACGDNCSVWMLKIGDIQDISVDLAYFIEWYEDKHKVEFMIENDGSMVYSRNEFADKASEFLNPYKEEEMQDDEDDDEDFQAFLERLAEQFSHNEINCSKEGSQNDE